MVAQTFTSGPDQQYTDVFQLLDHTSINPNVNNKDSDTCHCIWYNQTCPNVKNKDGGTDHYIWLAKWISRHSKRAFSSKQKRYISRGNHSLNKVHHIKLGSLKYVPQLMYFNYWITLASIPMQGINKVTHTTTSGQQNGYPDIVEEPSVKH
uniref:Uncharacterized protein n=1 Tax=Octopus bimaculoides TaxID=37653 RepID=A0A0L8FGN1_OCTBM